MAEHKTIHQASPAGTHPGCASTGVHEFACDACGERVRYTQRLGEDYVFHTEKVGYHDIDAGEDLCNECETERFAE